MHIAIEGVDGVGKTTICKMLAEKLNFKFVEKPLHYLFDSDDSFQNYYRIRDYINVQENKIFTSWFYGLGNIFLYHKFKDENIITDRHLVSNYFWSGDELSKPVFDCLTELIGKPDYTFLLYANEEEVTKRLKKRNRNDSDIKKVRLNRKALTKMTNFLLNYKMKYQIIDSTYLDQEEVLNTIIEHLTNEKLI
jgi:thymidylate kinase